MINKKTYKILNAVFAGVVIIGAALNIMHIEGGYWLMTLGLVALLVIQSGYIKHLENLNAKK